MEIYQNRLGKLRERRGEGGGGAVREGRGKEGGEKKEEGGEGGGEGELESVVQEFQALLRQPRVEECIR